MADKQVKDFYAILGVERDATEKEIKRSFRNLSKKVHPDVTDDPAAAEKFDMIKEAYDVLSDSEKRKEYDQFLKDIKNGRDLSFTDVLKKYYPERVQNNHSDIEKTYEPIKGEDLMVQVLFTVEEVRNKVEKEITFDRYVTCEECGGKGFEEGKAPACPDCLTIGYKYIQEDTPFGIISVRKPCMRCSGRGYIQPEKCHKCDGKKQKNENIKLRFQLPQSIHDGKKVTFPGKGDQGINGGPNGNLVLLLKQNPKDEYTITNTFDIEKVVKVPYLTALSGGTITTQGPDNKPISIQLNGNEDFDRFKVSVPDKGLFNSRNKSHGLLTISLDIEIPKTLTKEAKAKMIEALKM